MQTLKAMKERVADLDTQMRIIRNERENLAYFITMFEEELELLKEEAEEN